MQDYPNVLHTRKATLEQHRSMASQLAWSRLAVVIIAAAAGYGWLKTEQSLWGLLAAAAFLLFLYLVRRYQHATEAEQFSAALVQVTKAEMAYLDKKQLSFADGAALAPAQHAYAYDLDFFGPRSLYQHLNRASTQPGQQALAQALLTLQTNEEILARQTAIQELANQPDFRQSIQAEGCIRTDKPAALEALLQWTKADIQQIPSWVRVLSYLLPISLAVCLIAGMMFGWVAGLQWVILLYSLNLAVVGTQGQRIRSEISHYDIVAQSLRQYGGILARIEKQVFQSDKLKALQGQIKADNSHACREIARLSQLFSSLDSIVNLMAVLLLDGFGQFHLHTLQSLLTWKKRFAHQVPTWLHTMGEIEMLNSLANFSDNNPQFAFPQLNDQYQIHFQELGHPLLPAHSRIGNNLDLSQPITNNESTNQLINESTNQPSNQFIILTGSNMSGKSTFLRSMGINMVLTGMGAPVCAREARVHPMPVWVSMRLSDSLSDSESYFFAEVKRLQEIMGQLEHDRCFVLLDEILRGTNSDDKRLGTIGVLHKMVALKAVGAIATHDMEVCQTAQEYPHYLANQCFEVNIENDELVFDYRLRPGICQNKSATFIMEKMGIIDRVSSTTR